jgi:hypothetical protein
MSEPPNEMYVPPHMRESRVGIAGRALALVGVLLAVWGLASALRNASIVRGGIGVLVLAISAYWLLAKNKPR